MGEVSRDPTRFSGILSVARTEYLAIDCFNSKRGLDDQAGDLTDTIK